MLSDLLHSTFTQCYVYIIPFSYKFALNFVLSVDRLKECWLSHYFLAWSITLGRTRNFIPPPGCKGGGGLLEPLPRVFEMLQYFVMIFHSVESLWSSLQDEVYFMGGGAAGGLWRHQTWSLSWLPSWIFSRIRIQVTTARIIKFALNL